MSLAALTLPADKTDRRSTGYVPVSELPSRCTAAVRLAMGSDSYSDAHREDVAAELVARTVADAGTHGATCTLCSGPAAWRLPVRTAGRTFHLHRCGRHGGTGRGWRPVIRREDAVPADLCSVTRLYHLALTLRRSLDRAMARDAAEAAEAAERAPLEAHREGEGAEVRSTPHGARRAALDMLRNSGLVGERLPLPGARATSPHAPLWTLAYTAARAAAGLESEEIAAELDLDPAAHRKALSRAAADLRKVPGAQRAWAEALCILPGGISGKGHTATRLPESFGVRTAPGHTLPNTAEDRATVAVSPLHCTATRATRTPWHELPVNRRRTADWTAALPARSSSRLAAAAVITRKRAAAKSNTQRKADRAAAGITG